MSEISVFISYSHEDEKLRKQLEKHLTGLQKLGLISSWFDRMIKPGDVWEEEIDTRLSESKIILLLISPSFVHSNYCYGREMSLALELYDAGRTRIVPVILRPTSQWQQMPFGKFQALPDDAIPVTTYRQRDVAYKNIADGIAHFAREITAQSSLPNLTDNQAGYAETLDNLKLRERGYRSALHNIGVRAAIVQNITESDIENRSAVLDIDMIAEQLRQISEIASEGLANRSTINDINEHVDIGTIIERELDLLKVNEFFRIGVKLEYKKDRRSFLIAGNRNRLAQAFANVLRNAVESMYTSTARKLFVSISSEGQLVSIDIEDTGCGISEENIKNLYKEGFTTKKHRYPGDKGPPNRGLGLPTTRETIESHGGTIACQSRVGVGTAFRVSLPIASLDLNAKKRMATRNLVHGLEQNQQKSILVADDDQEIRELLMNFLKFSGFSAMQAPDGQQAFAKCLENWPDLVITDIHMPKMNGFQLLRAVKKFNPSTPVIFITGFAHFRRFFADKTARADGFLEKPFSLEAISSLVTRLMPRDSSTREK